MKKTLFVTAFLFLSVLAFAQRPMPPLPVKDSIPPKPVIKQYVLVMSEADLNNLVDFIVNIDIYSDKGRTNFLASLNRKIVIIPVAVDSLKK